MATHLIMTKSLNEVPIYRRFINERNQALDRIHWTASKRISNVLRGFLERVALAALAHYRGSDQRGFIDNQVRSYADALFVEFAQLRLVASVLAYAGEAQAIGLATSKNQTVKWDFRDSVEAIDTQGRDDEDSMGRITLSLNRIVRKAFDAAELARVTNEDEKEALERIINTFPRTKTYKRIPSPVRKLREASTNSPKTKLLGFIPDDVWQKVVEWYRTEEIGVDRSAAGLIDMGEFYQQDDIYQWELEKQLTDVFVRSVREGSIDAAKENGVEDFVWISVIDDRTDECCAWRNGLLLSEIERMIKDGEAPDGDECQDSLTPPIHFNCATAGHKITMSDWSTKMIEDIKPGDLVITHKGRPRVVERCLQSVANSLLVFTLENGEKITVTEDHPFLSEDKWKKAKEIKEGDYINAISQDQKSDN